MPLAISVALVFLYAVLLPLIAPLYRGALLQVMAQLPGFISINCGGLSSDYTDPATGLSWISDSNGFGLENVSHGATVSVTGEYPWLSSMRIFDGPQTKYCYKFGETYGIVQSNPYLVRASFWTGDELPFSTPNQGGISFMLLINADEWDSVDISLPQKDTLVMEVYVLAVLPNISVCVAGRGETAFISSLELRPINKSFSSVSQFMQAAANAAPRAMFLYSRLNLAATKYVRYPDDVYDRIWSADTDDFIVRPTPLIQTTQRLFNTDDPEQPPRAVLQSAYVLNSSFNLTFDDFPRSYDFYYVLFLAEILDNVTATQRVFDEETITTASIVWHEYDIDLGTRSDNNAGFRYSDLISVAEDDFLTFSFEKNLTSPLGPLVNALEVLYSSDGPMSLGTFADDVTALEFIKGSFQGFDSWKGDPCLPYPYEWLTCNTETQPRIIKLSLQERNITAGIPTEIGSLEALVEINLEGNGFSGSIPDSIASLPNLMTLYLQDNNLSGTVPPALLDKKIDLRLSGNPILCENYASYCGQQQVQQGKKKKSKNSSVIVVAILLPICAVVLLLLASIYIFRSRRKRKNDGGAAISNTEVVKHSNLVQHFTFQEIERMTNDFKNKLGAGGFGNVFLGMLSGGLNVAAKVSYRQDGTQEGLVFLNEVTLLSRVHHKNLVEFVGYCIQPRLVLVYEYMAKGSLENCLHGKYTTPLSWRNRLKIVVGAAQGLEYLHKGCKPPIIHRDVKCSNILLDDKLEGKISDFGISRLKLADTNETITNVQGTVGYIAPEYAELRISEKVDVFAFGVVLLEVVSGRRPLEASRHIIDWVRPLVGQSQLQDIVDPSMVDDYNISSMWKVLELAMACVEDDARKRPEMHEVSLELNQALSFELQNEGIIPAYDPSDLPFDTMHVVTR